MATEKRLIDANFLENRCRRQISDDWNKKVAPVSWSEAYKEFLDDVWDAPTVDAVEVPCHCCDCYYLLNGKNSLGLYFFCGHQNGLKNLRNTEKDFCLYAKKRMGCTTPPKERGDGNG